MPLIRHNTNDLVVNLSDLIVDSTVIKRKAKVDYTYNPSVRELSIILNISYYSKKQNGYGTSLPQIPSTSQTLLINSRMVIDSDTGDYMGDAGDLIDDVVKGTMKPAAGNKNAMLGFEFFKKKAELTGIKDDDIIQFVQKMDAAGKV